MASQADAEEQRDDSELCEYREQPVENHSRCPLKWPEHRAENEADDDETNRGRDPDMVAEALCGGAENEDRGKRDQKQPAAWIGFRRHVG